jgi:hypothetical protein
MPSTTSCWQANYHNAPTNVKITLADARAELESHGFVILEQQHPSSISNLLVGCLSECRWHTIMKIDTLIFVQELEAGLPLTVGRIQEDLHKLKTDWLPSLAPSIYSPIGCPPQGLFRGHLIVMVYLVQQPISSDLTRCYNQTECCC